MTTKQLRCAACEQSASAKWAWLWHSKEVALPRGGSSVAGSRVLWLCPDCAAELGDSDACDAVLDELVADEGDA